MKMAYGTGKLSSPGVKDKAAVDSPSFPSASLEISRMALEQLPATVSNTAAAVARAVTSKR